MNAAVNSIGTKGSPDEFRKQDDVVNIARTITGHQDGCAGFTANTEDGESHQPSAGRRCYRHKVSTRNTRYLTPHSDQLVKWPWPVYTESPFASGALDVFRLFLYEMVLPEAINTLQSGNRLILSQF